MASNAAQDEPIVKTRYLAPEERLEIIHFLLSESVNGAISRQHVQDAAQHTGRPTRTVRKLWQRYVACKTNSERLAVLVKPHATGGRPKKSREEVRERIRDVPMTERMNMRTLAEGAATTLYMIQQLLAEDSLKRKTTRLHPLLSEEQEVQRLAWVLSWLKPVEGGYDFVDMNNVIHIDEKWFNEDSDAKAYYVLDGETPPHRMQRSKRFIGKIMFLAAVARPRYDYHRKTEFNGKIGIWPFAETVTALRSSKNRPKGAAVLKPIESITKEVYKAYLLEHVFPAIKAQWPRGEKHKTIFVQQDNATPHKLLDDVEVIAAGREGGWDIRLLSQPPNSPDLNVLDLGYFASIQSLQYRKPCKSLEELVRVVGESFTELKPSKLDDIFATLQKVMEAILRAGGSNRYDLPRVHKSQLRAEFGCVPRCLPCDPAAVALARARVDGDIAESVV